MWWGKNTPHIKIILLELVDPELSRCIRRRVQGIELDPQEVLHQRLLVKT